MSALAGAEGLHIVECREILTGKHQRAAVAYTAHVAALNRGDVHVALRFILAGSRDMKVSREQMQQFANMSLRVQVHIDNIVAVPHLEDTHTVGLEVTQVIRNAQTQQPLSSRTRMMHLMREVAGDWKIAMTMDITQSI